MDIPFSQYQIVGETLLSLLCILGTLVEIGWSYKHRFICGLSILFYLVCMSVMPVPHFLKIAVLLIVPYCFDYCIFIKCLEIKVWYLLVLFFLELIWIFVILYWLWIREAGNTYGVQWSLNFPILLCILLSMFLISKKIHLLMLQEFQACGEC